MELKIVDSNTPPEPEIPEFATIEELKEQGLWPSRFHFLSAHGMTPYLKRMSREKLYGIEIGVLKGENVRLLLDDLGDKIGWIWGVDPYVAHTDQNTTRSQEDMDRYKEVMEKNLAGKEKFKLIQKTSAEAAAGFTDDSIDFVLLDGEHSYDGILNDLRAYYPKLKQNGHIFIHDCYLEDVRRAIDDFRTEIKCRAPIQMSKNFVHFWVKP